MNTLWFKILFMPVIIAGVTLAARKWGNVIGGVIAGMPWVGGAILFFIAKEQGEAFMAQTLSGVLVGLISWLGFCTTYIIVGQRQSVLLSFISGILSYLAIGIFLKAGISSLSIHGWLAVMLVLTCTSLYFFPKVKRQSKGEPKPLRFEIPLRMVMITIFVLIITYFANLMGPNWSGVLTPFPIMTATLAMFTHYTQGVSQARLALMGMYAGVIGFSIFLISIAYLMPHFGLGNGFLLALSFNVVATLAAKQLFSKLKLI